MEFVAVANEQLHVADGAFVKVSEADVERGEGVVGDKLLPFKPFFEQFLFDAICNSEQGC